MDVFALFTNQPYEFLELNQGVDGNTVKKATPATGIVKLRVGISTDGYSETIGGGLVKSAPTVHIKPDEPFLAEVGHNLEGHGIRVEGNDYRIIGATEGKDFDEGTVEFYLVTLKRENLASWDESELPLS